jgi:hypothetical protein
MPPPFQPPRGPRDLSGVLRLLLSARPKEKLVQQMRRESSPLTKLGPTREAEATRKHITPRMRVDFEGALLNEMGMPSQRLKWHDETYPLDNPEYNYFLSGQSPNFPPFKQFMEREAEPWMSRIMKISPKQEELFSELNELENLAVPSSEFPKKFDYYRKDPLGIRKYDYWLRRNAAYE